MTWFRRRNGEDRPLTTAGSRMVGDAEAFLAGSYEEQLRRRGEYVPTWARLNAFAHGDLESLQRLRRASDLENFRWLLDSLQQTWHRAKRILATELLEVVDGDSGMLRRLQVGVLIPLEQRLMRPDSELGAFGLVQITRAALRSSIR
jgi:hypothetical protein